MPRHLLFALSAAAAAMAASSSTQDKLVDKLEGMILLGAYGDALGVPTECVGLHGHTPPGQPTCVLAPLVPDPCHSNEWGIWPNQTRIEGTIGASSDDSAWRFAILQRWLLDEARGHPLTTAQVTEARLEAWMVQREAALWAREGPATETAVVRERGNPSAGRPPNCTLRTHSHWRPTAYDLPQVREREMLSDFLAMYDAAGRTPASNVTRGDNRFFVAGQPVVFGSYMYLEIGAVLSARRTGGAALEAYARFSALDQLWGRDVSGLLVALTGEAVRVADPAAQPFGAWFHERATAMLATQPSATRARETVRLRYATGLAWRAEGVAKDEYLRRYFELWQADSRHDEFKSQDPLTFLGQMSLVNGFCAGGDWAACTFSLLTASVGDTDTVASQLGVIAGAYHGASWLRATPCAGAAGAVLGAELQHADVFLARWFGASAAVRAAELLRALAV